MYWSGVRPFVSPVFFLILLGRAAHTQRDSQGVSTRRGQHTFLSEYYEDGHVVVVVVVAAAATFAIS